MLFFTTKGKKIVNLFSSMVKSYVIMFKVLVFGIRTVWAWLGQCLFDHAEEKRSSSSQQT